MDDNKWCPVSWWGGGGCGGGSDLNVCPRRLEGITAACPGGMEQNTSLCRGTFTSLSRVEGGGGGGGGKCSQSLSSIIGVYI